MLKYVVKRLLYAIPVFLGITFVIYLLINLAPGGPLAILASSGEMSQADLEAMKVTLGLDKPIVVRYFLWLVDLFRGDLGTSDNRRIGDKPYIVEVGEIESVDIDEAEDFMIADAIYNYELQKK